MKRLGGLGGAVLALSIVSALGPPPAHGQGVRGEIQAVGSYVEYLTVHRVAVPEGDVPGDGLVRHLADGTVVTCIPGGDCYYYKAGDVESSTPITEELRLTAWPGMRGVYARARVRGRFGSDDFWPKSSEDFEVLSLNADFERNAYRVRAGRQERGGGLGFHYFDGASVLWKGWRPLRVEGFGGRSLDRSLVQTYSGDLLEEADYLAPDKPANIWGVEGKVRLGPVFSGALLYQREIRTDSDGLYSERMALDAQLANDRSAVEVSADYDFGADKLTDGRLRLRTGAGRMQFSAEGRTYRPFFPLWTIWGVFAPVGYAEGRGTARVIVNSDWSVHGTAAYRDYEETDAGVEFAPIEGDGWRLGGGLAWTHRPWTAAFDAGIHRGYGAARTEFDVSAGRTFGALGYLGLYGQTTEQFTEFRFGEGKSSGAGVEGWIAAGDVRLDGSVAWYHHSYADRPGYENYDQLRGRLGVTLAFGTEPQPVTRIGKGGRS